METKKKAAAIAVSFAILALAACSEGPAEKAGKKIDKAMEDARDKISGVIEKSREEAREMVESGKEKAKELEDAAREKFDR